MSLSDEIAAQCWCDPKTSDIEMDIRLAEVFASRLNPENAMKILVEAFQNDPAYAFGWHSNIAMMCADAIEDFAWQIGDGSDDNVIIGNDAASRFMKLCFGVETDRNMLTKNPLDPETE